MIIARKCEDISINFADRLARKILGIKEKQ
jgi:hypothetical protein